MSLINCPECGKEVSDQAVSCPNCAFPFRKDLKSLLKKTVSEKKSVPLKTNYPGVEIAFAPYYPVPEGSLKIVEYLGEESYSFKNTRLDHRGLFHEGKFWDLSHIRAIQIVFVNVNYRANAIVDMGTSVQGEFAAHFKDDRLIRIKARGPIHAFTIGKANRRNNEALDLADAIARVTFKIRLFKYLKQMEDCGYFAYDSVAFYRDGTVVRGKREANLYRDKVKRFSSQNRLDVVVPKSKLSGALSFVKYQDIFIETYTDNDVFFYLLKSLFNLSWK